jgi:hypothetical protein
MRLLCFKPAGVLPSEFLGEVFEFDPSSDTSLKSIQLSLGDIEHAGPPRLGPRQIMALVVTGWNAGAGTGSLAARTS